MSCKLLRSSIVCTLYCLCVYCKSLTTSKGLSDSREYPIASTRTCNAYTRWALFKVKIRPQQKLKAKLGDGQTFMHGPSFASLQEIHSAQVTKCVGVLYNTYYKIIPPSGYEHHLLCSSSAPPPPPPPAIVTACRCLITQKYCTCNYPPTMHK